MATKRRQPPEVKKDELIERTREAAVDSLPGYDVEHDPTAPEFAYDFEQVLDYFSDQLSDDLRPTQINYLAAYVILGSNKYAAQVAGLHPQTPVNWRNDDYSETYLPYLKMADDMHTEYLEQEVKRRALMGTREPIVYKGEVTGYRRKKSDNLLMFILKGREPEKYRDNARIEVTGEGGGPIEVEFTVPQLNQEVESEDGDVIEGEVVD